MTVLGLRFCARAFSSCGKRGPLFIAVRGHLLLRSTGSRRAGSVVVARGPQIAGSVVVAHGLSCSTACGIFPDQGSNPCPLHWQADSQPLRHQGNPYRYIFNPLFNLVLDESSLYSFFLNITYSGTSLVAQWLRICLPVQGTRVRALV